MNVGRPKPGKFGRRSSSSPRLESDVACEGTVLCALASVGPSARQARRAKKRIGRGAMTSGQDLKVFRGQFHMQALLQDVH